MSAFSEIFKFVMNLFQLGMYYAKEIVKLLIGNLPEIQLNDASMGFLTTLLGMKSKMEVKGQQLYNEYSVVRKCTDNIVYFRDCGKALCMDYRIEPLQDNWISVSHVEKNNTDIFLETGDDYNEKYYFFKPAGDIGSSLNDYYKKGLDSICDIAKGCSSSTKMETLITAKIDNKYTFFSIFHNSNIEETEYKLPTGNGKKQFISVEYTHPEMPKGIVMELNTNLFYEKNHLLTPTFVRRYLEHQEEPYIFDTKYVIKIMDTNINTITIKPNQYIQLKRMGYDVINVYSDDDMDKPEPEPEPEPESEPEPEPEQSECSEEVNEESNSESNSESEIIGINEIEIVGDLEIAETEFTDDLEVSDNDSTHSSNETETS